MRNVTIEIEGLNITATPHTGDTYINLLKSAGKLKDPIKFYGSHYAVVREVKLSGDGRWVIGRVYRFLDFNSLQKWFNIERDEEAGEDDVRKILIPPHLKPEFSATDFAFFVERHQLFFVSFTEDKKSFRASRFGVFFSNLLNHGSVSGGKQVNVTPIPQKDSLKHMRSLRELQKVSICLKEPNPDDLYEAEKMVQRKLEAMHARRIDVNISAIAGESLVLDQEMNQFAAVASENGSVSWRGINQEGVSVAGSTLQYPWRMPLRVGSEHSGSVVFRTAIRGYVAQEGTDFSRIGSGDGE
ncbi:MAG: DUF4747 family protein [Magnetococcales bacterium]|nr:DUF4747 family protein [Magnetococcales bacterium]